MILPGIGGLVIRSAPFPTLRGSVQTSSQNSGTSFSPTIPTHQAGDVILVFVGYDQRGSGISGSAGWTEKSDGNNGANEGLALYTRTATTSAHTITITNGNNAPIGAHVYVLQYCEGTVLAADAGSDDPPNLATTWGSDSTLWLVAACSSSLPSAGPTGFSNGVQTTAGRRISTMDKQDTAASLNPDAFTNASSAISMTVAVRPL